MDVHGERSGEDSPITVPLTVHGRILNCKLNVTGPIDKRFRSTIASNWYKFCLCHNVKLHERFLRGEVGVYLLGNWERHFLQSGNIGKRQKSSLGNGNWVFQLLGWDTGKSILSGMRKWERLFAGMGQWER